MAVCLDWCLSLYMRIIFAFSKMLTIYRHLIVVFGLKFFLFNGVILRHEPMKEWQFTFAMCIIGMFLMFLGLFSEHIIGALCANVVFVLVFM